MEVMDFCEYRPNDLRRSQRLANRRGVANILELCSEGALCYRLEMQLRTLSVADIPAAMDLSTGAGWNQTASDWIALLSDSPDGCLGIECDGRVVATTTVVCYEKRLAWIGMVLTDADYRRRGFARMLVSRAIELAHERDVQTIKLDATDEGRALYTSLGFGDEQPVERWGCDVVSLTSFDRYRPNETPAIAEPDGYLLHRPGIRAHYLGPCIAGSPQTAERLFRRALDEIGADHYFWDLLPANRDAVALARRLDFAPVRRLTRMVLGPNPSCDESRIYGIAGFEWG
jgi:GNAT superfamily N-acetyltransferase